MDALWSLLMFLGSSICHQLPERSYLLGELQMPLCARCIGIHFGFLVSLLFLSLGPKRYCSKILGPKQLVIIGAMMAFYAIDSSVSYLGLSESDNLRRTLSGLALGVAFPFFLLPFVNSFLFPGRNSTKPIERSVDWLALAALYLIGAGAILLVEDSRMLFYAVSALGIAGVFAFFSTSTSFITLLGFDKSRTTPNRRFVVGVTLAICLLLLVAVMRQYTT